MFNGYENVCAPRTSKSFLIWCTSVYFVTFLPCSPQIINLAIHITRHISILKLIKHCYIIFIYNIEIVYVCSLLARERIHRSAPNLAYLFLETRKRTQKGQNSGKVSSLRVPVSADPVPRKLSTIEESRLSQLFVSKKRLQKQRSQLRKTLLGLILGEDGFCSSEIKQNRRTAPRPKFFVSKRRLQKQRPQRRTTCPGFESR
jgi:hypothetical protein